MKKPKNTPASSIVTETVVTRLRRQVGEEHARQLDAQIMAYGTDVDCTEKEAQNAVRTLLRFLGEDTSREGLRETPKRVVKAFEEMTRGYFDNPADILNTDFPAGNYDEMIALPWIEFTSLCEHHLLGFIGFAHVAYVPSKKSRVVGVSKLARLVDCFAKRLQIQEQMTAQVADALVEHLKPKGVAVVVQAKHLCMLCRGVQKRDSVMVTSAMRGVFLRSTAARAEFFKLVELAKEGTA